MNWRRGSTSSPMSLVNISSASTTSVMSMRSSLRFSGFMVVSNNSLAFIRSELAARFDFVAHEFGEHLLGLDHVGHVNAQQLAVLRVHGGFKQLLGVHPI